MTLQYRTVFSGFKLQQNDLEGLLKHRSLGATLRVSDSLGLGWLRICISNKFPGDADAGSLGTTP